MNSDPVTLEIELEDVGGTSWWAGIATTLASQSGNANMRFVGTTNGVRRFKGSTFPLPRTFGTLPPQEDWAPGMTRSLEELVPGAMQTGRSALAAPPCGGGGGVAL